MTGDSSEMDYEGVKAGLEDNSIVLIDVRTTEERKEEHGAIPGSKHIWSKLYRLELSTFINEAKSVAGNHWLRLSPSVALLEGKFGAVWELDVSNSN